MLINKNQYLCLKKIWFNKSKNTNKRSKIIKYITINNLLSNSLIQTNTNSVFYTVNLFLHPNQYFIIYSYINFYVNILSITNLLNKNLYTFNIKDYKRPYKKFLIKSALLPLGTL